MPHISNNKEIREFVQKILRTNNWKISRQGKHTVIRHLAYGANRNIIVPSTPSCPHAFENFQKDYYRYLRNYFKTVGIIL